jgi:hypothetical protein
MIIELGKVSVETKEPVIPFQVVDNVQKQTKRPIA